MTFMVRWLDRMIPPAVAPDGDGRFRARVLLGTAAATAVMALLLGLCHVILGGARSSAVLLIALAPLLLAVPAVLAAVRSVTLVGVGAAVLVLGAAAAVALEQGGMRSGAIMVLPLVPLVVTLFAGARAGGWLALVVVGLVMVLYALDPTGLDGATLASERVARLAFAVAAVLGGALIGVAYDLLRRLAAGIPVAGSSPDQLTLDMLPDTVLIVDGEGRVVRAQFSASSNLVRGAADELPGRPITEALPDELGRSVYDHLREAARFGDESAGECAFNDGDAVCTVEVRTRRVEGSRFLVLLRDITDRRRSERFGDEFVSVVNHQLRTPLTAIRGALGLLTAGVMHERPENRDQLIDVARRNADRLGALVDDLRDLQQIKSGQMRFEIHTAPIGSLLQQVLELNRAYSRSYGVQLEFEGTLPEADVRVDVGRFQQVLSSLISNAVKFSPSGGVVTVSGTVDDETVQIDVADTGPGMPEAVRTELTRRLAGDGAGTLDSSMTGLGLFIAHRIVLRFRGRLSFETRQGTGTVFRVVLPRASANGG